MDTSIYDKLAKEAAPKKKVWLSVLLAALGGGIIALIMQGSYDLLTKVAGVEAKDALMYNSIIVILLTMVLTIFGGYKKLAQIFKAGMFIPITGFANSVISEGIEYRYEGPIYGVGSRLFSLAGSVIVYGISGAFVYGVIIYVLMICGVAI